MKSIKQSLTVFGVAIVVSTATAQTNIIFGTDFDGDTNQGDFNTFYGYVAAGSSLGISPAGNNFGLVGGSGVGGTTNLTSAVDYTLLPADPNWTNASETYVYANLAAGTQFSGQMTPIVPTAVLSSFTLSADIQVLGLLPALTTTPITISKLQFFDSSNNIIFDFTGTAGFVGSNYVHIAVPLSSLSYGGVNGPNNGPDATHPVTDFTNAAVVSSITNFTVEFAVEGTPIGVIGGTGTNLISPPFGFTTNGELNVDNIQLTQNTNNVVPTPTQEKLIWQANFDTTFPNVGGYGFHYRDTPPADNATGTLTTNLTGGVGGSASLEYTADLSSWISSPPTSFSGFGVGATENPLPYVLSSAAVASYRVYLSAKVGGASSGVTNFPGVVDLFFKVPPGTLTPSNTTEATVLDLNPSLTLKTNWQSYVFNNMPIGIFNGGSQALFNQYVSNVNQLQLQVVPQGNPNAATLFGYDANNTVDIDNIKVVQVVTGLAPIMVVRTNNQVQVIWTDPPTGGAAKLQGATNVAGSYFDVSGAPSGASSPYTVPPGNHQQFFRTVWVP
jgi:hypothetical protein